MNIFKATTGIALALAVLCVFICPAVEARKSTALTRGRSRKYSPFEGRAMKTARMMGGGYFTCMRQYVCGAGLDRVGPIWGREDRIKNRIDCFAGGKDVDDPQCQKSCAPDAGPKAKQMARCRVPNCKNKNAYAFDFCQTDCTDPKNENEGACQVIDCSAAGANDDYRCKPQSERDNLTRRRQSRVRRRDYSFARRVEKLSMAKTFSVKKAKWLLRRAEPDAPAGHDTNNPPSPPNTPTDPANPPKDGSDDSDSSMSSSSSKGELTMDNIYEGECTGGFMIKMCRITEAPFHCAYRCLFKQCTPYWLPEDVVQDLQMEHG